MNIQDLRAVFGVIALLLICIMLSKDRRAINWRLVFTGVILQVVLAVLLLKVSPIREMFRGVVDFFLLVIGSMQESAEFIFGELAMPSKPYGFAFVALPTIVFFSAISSLLYYLGILQKVVYVFAWIMKKSMNLTGAESLAAAANVFIGQTEAPIIVKPYISKMSKSEIMSLMTGGMATIAGSVFGLYMVMLGGDSVEEKTFFGMHLLTASIISAPASLLVAKILVPENPDAKIDRNLDIPTQSVGDNALDAIVNGTTEGVKLAVNVGAMLLSFMAFVYLFNKIFMGIGEWSHINTMIVEHSGGTFDGLTLQFVLGYIFSPVAWLLGSSTEDVLLVGRMLGEKTVLNEFFGYLSLAELKEAGLLSERSIVVATYALCGFANFGSVGIQIGGISVLAPDRRKTLIQLGMYSLIGGTIACFLTAAIAGIIV